MIILSQSIVLAPKTNPLGTPIFGWRTLVTAGNVSATSEADGFPASNVANRATYQTWKAEGIASPPEDEYLTVTIPENEIDPIDYLAVAVHNFGTGQIAVSVEGASELVGSPADYDWQELVEESIPANDDPIIFRFTPQSLIAVRLRMQPSLAETPEAPFAGVVYVGKLLVCERGTHADHVPINLARQSEVENGMSETGQFVGRNTLRESRSTTFALKLLRSTWFTTSMQPFLDDAVDNPFFFAWRPAAFPNDVGYCWLKNDPQPAVHFETGRKAVDLQLGGVTI